MNRLQPLAFARQSETLATNQLVETPPTAPIRSKLLATHKAEQLMKVLLFTQPGCLSCELMRVYLEAREIPFEERDITSDSQARSEMLDLYDSPTTPTLVVSSGEFHEVVVGFDPERLDQLLSAASSSDTAIKS